MKRFGLMLVVGVAGLAWGYGDLPDTFDASTGYVTLTIVFFSDSLERRTASPCEYELLREERMVPWYALQ